MFNVNKTINTLNSKASFSLLVVTCFLSSSALMASDENPVDLPKKVRALSRASAGPVHSFETDIDDLMEKTHFQGTVFIVNNTKKKACIELVHDATVDGRKKRPWFVEVIGGFFDDIFSRSKNQKGPASSRSGMNPGMAWIPSKEMTVIKDYSPNGNKIKLITNKKCFLNLTSIAHDVTVLSIDDVQMLVYPRPAQTFNFVPTLFEPIAELPDWVRNNADKIIKLCPQYPPNDDMSSIDFRKEFDNHIITIAYLIGPQEGIKDVRELYEKRAELYNLYNFNIFPRQLPALGAPRIPLITHTIWLTNPAKPVEFPEESYMKWALQSAELMPACEGWKHYLWVQNKKLLPKTAKKLKHTGLEIKEIYEDCCFDELKDLPKFGTRKIFEKALSECRFGMASDIFRLEVLKRMGGIYKDTDYIFAQNPYLFMHMYDSFYGIEPMSTFLCNALMAAKPKHPITKAAIKLIKRNFDPREAPDYVLDIPEDDGYLTIASTGPIVTMLAFHTAAGLDGNHDIAFPPEVLYPAKIPGMYPQKEIVTEDDALTEHSVGRHLWQGAWVKKAPKDDRFGSNG